MTSPYLPSRYHVGTPVACFACIDTRTSLPCPRVCPPIFDEHQQPSSHSHSPTALFAERKRRDPYLPPDPSEPPSNPLFELTASLASIASAQIPVPFVGGGTKISLGFPLFLASTILLLPTSTSILLCTFFAGFWYLGRSVIGSFDLNDIFDKEEMEEISGDVAVSDLLALVGSIASAGLLSPDGFATDTGGGILSDFPTVGVGLLGVASVSIVASLVAQSNAQAKLDDTEIQDAANRRLMGIFDDKLDLMQNIVPYSCRRGLSAETDRHSNHIHLFLKYDRGHNLVQ